MKRILIAGGGTAGHIYPGLAVADAVKKRYPKTDVIFAATSRPIDSQVLATLDGIETMIQPIRPFKLTPIGIGQFTRGWAWSYFQMRHLLRDKRIDTVLGLGGFGSSAAVAAAHRLGIRRAILNPDAVPGKANRLLARFVDVVFVQWAQSTHFFGRKTDTRVVGCPVREGFKQLATMTRQGLRQEAMTTFNLDERRRTLLICGGSTGAQSVNQAVIEMLVRGDLPSDVQVLHVTGRNNYKEVHHRYTEQVKLTYRVIDYLDRMELAYAAADLVVCRAGAVTAAEVATAGVPAIFMPYPFHRDQHQRANAQVLADAGGAMLVDDDGQASEPTVKALSRAVRTSLDDRYRLVQMSQNLQRLARVDADQEIAQWLMSD